jgi:hypothetical protein
VRAASRTPRLHYGLVATRRIPLASGRFTTRVAGYVQGPAHRFTLLLGRRCWTGRNQQQQRFKASTLWYEATPDLFDVRLGRILRLQPLELQRRIAAVYGSADRLEVGYGSADRLEVGYGSNPAQSGCTGTFHAGNDHIEITFGLSPWLTNRPYLGLRRLP